MGYADRFISDTISRIPVVAPTLAEVPCGDILGLVIYDLPGRDCAAKASNGELAVGELARYKSEYIDRMSRHFNSLPAILTDHQQLLPLSRQLPMSRLLLSSSPTPFRTWSPTPT